MLGFAPLGAAPLGLPAAAAAPAPPALTPQVCLDVVWRRPRLGAAWLRGALDVDWRRCP